MTLVKARPKTKKRELVAEMSSYLCGYLATLAPEEAEARLRAAERALAATRSVRRPLRAVASR